MREFRDRRDRTSWACSAVPQHVTQPSTSNNTHHPYPDPDHSSESKPLSLTTSCLPSVSSSGSPHLQSSSPHSALTPSLPPVYTVQRNQNRFFTPAIDSQETVDGVGSEQRGIQNQSTSEHRHHQLTPLVSFLLLFFLTLCFFVPFCNLYPRKHHFQRHSTDRNTYSILLCHALIPFILFVFNAISSH